MPRRRSRTAFGRKPLSNSNSNSSRGRIRKSPSNTVRKEPRGRQQQRRSSQPPPRYLPTWEIHTMQSLWKLIRVEVKCIRIRNASFEIIDRNREVLKVFAKDSVNDLLRFMLLEGIPDGHKLSSPTLKRLTEEIMMVNVPKRLLFSAQRAGSGQKNGMTLEDTEILSNEKIVPLLESFGYRFSMFGDRIYSPPTVPSENCYFNSLPELRAHIRTQPSLPLVDTSAMHPLLHRKRTLLIRIWAATSSKPLPKFRFENFSRRKRPVRSFLQFEDEISCVEGDDDDEDDLDDVWSVHSYGSRSSVEDSRRRPSVFARLFGDGDCSPIGCVAPCPTVTTRTKSTSRPQDSPSISPKSLADLSLMEDTEIVDEPQQPQGEIHSLDADEDVGASHQPQEEIHSLDADEDVGASHQQGEIHNIGGDDSSNSVVVRVTAVQDTTEQSAENHLDDKQQSSLKVFLSDPVYSACEWVDFRCCGSGDGPNAFVQKPVVTPESAKHTREEEEESNEIDTIVTDDKSQWSINDLEAENEKLRYLLEKLNPRKAHSGKLEETNNKLKAGIEFMKRSALLDEYSELMLEYERLQKESSK